MKRLLLILTAATAMAGCSSLQTADGDRPGMSSSKYDAEYIRVVEARARYFGTRVIWVHPPEADDTSN